MSRNYWLNLYTGRTWEEFLKNGADTSGFRAKARTTAKKVKPGDYFICYMTGISRFIGITEAISESYEDDTPLWEDETFPVRFRVRPIKKLTPKTAVPVHDLLDKLSITQNLKSKNAWTGFFRGSPKKFSQKDAEIIMYAIDEAQKNPVERDYDERMYRRKPIVFEDKKGDTVTVPSEEKEEAPQRSTESKITHEEIQWMLLKLGSDMGLDVWVARNDRNREFNGKVFKDIKKIRDDIPRQFDNATNKTIEYIDVIWLQGDAIVAAFEVEHSTSIYSGLLRMSDLITMQPNLKINLYIVAPDERHDKVITEINRATFSRLRPPLPKICKFIPYSELKRKVEQIDNMELARHLKPEFIEEIAVSCEPEEA